MLPAPDAARVFAFRIAFSSCICYDWRAVGYQFAASYNRPRCVSTGGGFLLFEGCESAQRCSLDKLSIDTAISHQCFREGEA